MVARDMPQPLFRFAQVLQDGPIVFDLGIGETGIDVLVGESILEIFYPVTFIGSADRIKFVSYTDDQPVGTWLFKVFDQFFLGGGILGVVDIGDTKQMYFFGQTLQPNILRLYL